MSIVKYCKDGRIQGQNNKKIGTLGTLRKYIKKGWNPKSASIGRECSVKTKRKMSETHKRIGSKPPLGEKHWNWKGGISSATELIRVSAEYRQWRKTVFERDNYTCLICGEVGGELNAHHIKPFNKFPELRFVISNGVTMCIKCHKLEKKGIGKNN